MALGSPEAPRHGPPSSRRTHPAVVALVASLLVASPGSARPRCHDGMTNGNESDVDCGGACSPCEVTRACRVARDCASGRCAAGACAERSWVEGEEVPAGYVLEPSERDRAATARRAGLLFLSVGYGAAYVTAFSFPQRYTLLYVPVAGPWAALGRPGLRPEARALLVADGAMQTAGALLVLGGAVGAGQQLLRQEAVESARRPGSSVPLHLSALGLPGGGLLSVGGAW